MKVLDSKDIENKLGVKAVSTPEKKPSEIDEADTEARQKLRNYFLYLLSRREYSVQELFRKAQEKKHDLKIFDQVLLELQQDKYQCDQRFSHAFLRTRILRQQGANKIKMELRQKGISDTLIAEAMDASDCDWFELAKEVADKKFKPIAENADFTEKQKAKAKLMRFLASRGFSADQINYAIDGKFS